jgi:outer membrane protein
MLNKFFIPAIAIQILICAEVALAGEEGSTTTTRSTSTSSSSSMIGLRSFTLDEAIKTALQQNPTILLARQEIRRTKGVFIEVLSQAIPHIIAADQFTRTDPKLGRGGSFSSGSGGVIGSSGDVRLTDNSYFLRVQATQLVYSGTFVPAIRGADFQRDSAFFGLRNAIDQIITTVRQQFYQVILNKALIGVQEESVRLLESQLKDQQNRFEAGTVPRFNVLQAEVALANQQPFLIAANNNFRISQLQLAKTLGLDFDPSRGEGPPLECKGELVYQPRVMALEDAIEMGKQRRPFLKQQKANVQNARQQVGVAFGGFHPTINANASYEWDSSPFSSDIEDVRKGWFWGATGSWNIFDGLATVGRIKQQRALLSQSQITYDDDVRQVELEVQTAFANLQKDRETIQSQEKTVEQATEAFRLASARLGAGAGTQLDVLNAQVALTQASSTLLQALYSYNADLAEFDRVTATQTIYSDMIDLKTRPATRSATTMTTTQTARKTTTTQTKAKSKSAKASSTPWPTPTPTPTSSPTPTATPTPTPTPTATPTPTPTPTPSPAETP